MNDIIIFSSSNNAIALASNVYNGPMRYALVPDDFDANNWLYYTITSNNEVVMIASDEMLEIACQNYLDSFAQTKGYSNILSASSYANSSNGTYKIEGTYATDARDNTWISLYNIISEVHANTRPPIRCFSDIIPELPQLKWPDDISVTEDIPSSNT